MIEGESKFNNMGVEQALKTGKVGFEEISDEAMNEVITNAPKDASFEVPSNLHAERLAAIAKLHERTDVTFETKE